MSLSSARERELSEGSGIQEGLHKGTQGEPHNIGIGTNDSFHQECAHPLYRITSSLPKWLSCSHIGLYLLGCQGLYPHDGRYCL